MTRTETDVVVTVPVGQRVLLASDLHLGGAATPASEQSSTELARALESWSGPGTVILAGDMFELVAERHGDPSRALNAHPRLASALRAFSSVPGRRLLLLTGATDRCVADNDAAVRTIERQLGAQVAAAADLEIATGSGSRRVRVEHAPAALDAESGGPRLNRKVTAPWLEGIEHVADQREVPGFLASRLAYRRLGRRAWWLALPFAAVLALRALLVLLGLIGTQGADRWLAHWTLHAGLLGIAAIADLALVATTFVFTMRRAWQAFSELDPEVDAGSPNARGRARAEALAAQGYAGVVTGYTHHAELSDLGRVWYANTGCGGLLVEQRPARFGLPPVYEMARVQSWIELEAGADLHVRLMYHRVPVGSLPLAERFAIRRQPVGDPRPVVVASLPGGASWPPAKLRTNPARRVRRIGGLLIAAAGLLNLVSALTPPLASRLRSLGDVVPLAVEEGAAAAVAFAGLGLLLVARGVRRGQRHAWTLAISLLVLSAGLHLAKGLDLEESLIALGIAAYLLANSRYFRARPDRPSIIRGFLVLAFGASTAIIVGVAAIQLHRRSELRLPLWTSVQAVAERLVFDTSIGVPGRVGDFLTPTMGAIGVGLAVFAGWMTFRPVVSRHRTGGAEERARSIVARHGGGTLSYFALRRDKEHWFWGDSVVAYAVHNGVCLVSPDPIGPVAERDGVWPAFHRFAELQGWTVAVMGAGESWLPIYRAAGMHDLYIGDEAVVDVERFNLEGGRAKGLRQAVNRVARNGYRVEFFDPAKLDVSLEQALRTLMTESRRGDVERGFSMTLGRIFDRADTGLLLAVCFGPDQGPVAFCQYVPAIEINGYSLDLMRRTETGDHPNGLTDFVVVETIRYLRERGYRQLGLNFATMRAVLAGEAGDGVRRRVERWLLARMSDSMQIESLWRYNAKFDPEWRPRYVVYDGAEHLLSTGIAVAKAESFWELPVIGRFFGPSGAPPVIDTVPAAPDPEPCAAPVGSVTDGEIDGGDASTEIGDTAVVGGVPEREDAAGRGDDPVAIAGVGGTQGDGGRQLAETEAGHGAEEGNAEAEHPAVGGVQPVAAPRRPDRK